MSDLVYLLITVLSFVGLALLVGVVDRWLADGEGPIAPEDPASRPGPARADLPAAVR